MFLIQSWKCQTKLDLMVNPLPHHRFVYTLIALPNIKWTFFVHNINNSFISDLVINVCNSCSCLTDTMYMQAFLINLLVGSFFGEGTASANSQVNNSGVCEKLSACVGISSPRDLVGKSCIYNLGFVLTTNRFFKCF